MPNINIDDGRVPITINGDPERVIYIQPSDFNIQMRANQAEKNISELLSTFDNVNPENFKEYAALLEEVDRKTREEINNIFNYDVSKPVFGACSPFMTLKSGKCYVEEFLDAIIPIIKEYAEKAAKASEKRIAKHTKRYD